LQPARARELLAEAMSGVAAALRPHAVANVLAPASNESVRKLAERTGIEGLELRLLGGYGSVEEMRLVRRLWDLAQGRASMAGVIAEFGFHGPDEGEISSRSWREDPGPLLALMENYRSLEGDETPQAREDARAAERRRAEEELLATCSRSQRSAAQLALRSAATFTVLREVGKANFLKGIDAGRAAARGCGADLARRGVLDAPEDVFYLTVSEIIETLPAAPREVIAHRKALRERYLGMNLPELWVGQAGPTAERADELLSGALEGIAASAGTALAPARVILRAADCHEVQPGEILVCNTTDPSWASVFPLVSALVIDIGGPISHGAIIARELGLPCVINTRTGTSMIRTGDVLSVDGTGGKVEIIERSAA
jgi:pyruvate,water dikinase